MKATVHLEVNQSRIWYDKERQKFYWTDKDNPEVEASLEDVAWMTEVCMARTIAEAKEVRDFAEKVNDTVRKEITWFNNTLWFGFGGIVIDLIHRFSA